MIYWWGISGGLTAVGLEWLFSRATAWSWFQLFPFIVLPALYINLAVFHLVRGSENLIAAFVLFALCTLGGRVVVSVLFLPAPLPWSTWAALGLLVIARVVQRVGV